MYKKQTMNIPDFRNLIVWQKAMDLNLQIYDVTSKFPKSENFIMRQQIIRSCTSISANIAEGNGNSQTPKRELNHINIAIGSTTETLNWLILAQRRNYITLEQYNNLYNRIEELLKMLYGYRKSIDIED